MKALVTHWRSLIDVDGNPVETTWEKLFDRFSRVRSFAGDREHPGWSAAVFDPPKRAEANVREVTAIVLDYDGGETIDDATSVWGDYFGMMHTTRKHTPDAHRFRVILPLSRPVTPNEYARLWRQVYAMSGEKLDPSPKDPSRFWFTPGIRDDGEFVVRRFNGEPIDVEELLKAPDVAQVIDINTPRLTAGDHERRAIAYIDKMDPAISGSGGHQACWAVARKLAQDFGFDESTTFRILWQYYNPRCTPPWTEKELRHKAKDAVLKARITNPVRGDHWEMPRHHYAVSSQTTAPAEDLPPEEREGKKLPAAERFSARTVGELFEAVVVRAETHQPEIGAPTGSYTLDAALGGFRRQRVTVLGAETSWGKSSFAIMAADESMKAGHGVLLISGEDGAETYGQRLMARRARLNAFRVRDNTLEPKEIDVMKAYAARAERTPFFIDGIGKTAEYLSAAIGSICAEHDIALVIVDYLQAFRCAKRCQDRRTEVTHIARCFVDAIKTANTAGLLLSQLRRPENSVRAPTMHDLKESGDLENMAEHVLLGCLDRNDNLEQRSIIIGKNKDGPRDNNKIAMPFDAETTASFITQRGKIYAKRPSAWDEFDSIAEDGERYP